MATLNDCVFVDTKSAPLCRLRVLVRGASLGLYVCMRGFFIATSERGACVDVDTVLR